MVQDKIKFIKGEILKSGFPLEMEISAILRKRDYGVSNGVYFFDFDEKKPREFDIAATLPFEKITSSKFKAKEPWLFNPSVLIECKKSAVYSWVFFRSKPIAGWLDIGHSIDVLTEKHGYMNSACGHVLTEVSPLHYNEKDTIIVGAYQQVKLEKNVKNKGNGKNAILDATSKVIKFMDYSFQHLKEFFTTDSTRRDMVFYFPFIVFDGELYEASFGKTLELKESRHVIYETRYLSSLTKSMVPLYIDIVRKDAIEDILSVVENEAYYINEYLRKPESQKLLSAVLDEQRR